MRSFKFFTFTFVAVISMIDSLPLSESEGRSLLELGDKYQGDIVLTPEQEKILNSTRNSKTGLLNLRYRWPKNSAGYVEVPLSYHQASGYTDEDKEIVRLALNDLEEKTCLKFIQRTTQIDYIEIIHGRACYSYFGRIGGKQQLQLNRPNCLWKGTIIHEFIHSLGFQHMHNHADRDNFIKVNFDNVAPSRRYNFDKVRAGLYDNFGTPYDYLSIMHYHRDAFSTNGGDTLVPVDKSFIDLIGAYELSVGDITRINNMYECTNSQQ